MRGGARRTATGRSATGSIPHFSPSAPEKPPFRFDFWRVSAVSTFPKCRHAVFNLVRLYDCFAAHKCSGGLLTHGRVHGLALPFSAPGRPVGGRSWCPNPRPRLGESKIPGNSAPARRCQDSPRVLVWLSSSISGPIHGSVMGAQPAVQRAPARKHLIGGTPGSLRFSQ